MTVRRENDGGIVSGEFVTDGKTFVLTIKGTPLSGTGTSASAAFDELMRAEATAGDLADGLRRLARDQEGELVRATLVRWSMIGLIIFGTVAGALTAGAAIAPKVLPDLGHTVISKLFEYFDHMSPDSEQKVSELLQRADRLLGDDRACAPGSAPALSPAQAPAQAPADGTSP